MIYTCPNPHCEAHGVPRTFPELGFVTLTCRLCAAVLRPLKRAVSGG